jgi:hypothetical protein
MGKFTTNPTQYIPLCNPAKYIHIYDRRTGFITVKNIAPLERPFGAREDRVIGVFDYPELCEYFELRC